MIYLDNASTTFPKAPGVAEAMSRYITDVGASPGRGAYALARESGQIVTDTRNALAGFINAPDPDRVIFTASCTDALNIAIKGCLQPGDHVVTTMLEHNSVSRPLEALRRNGVITLTRVPFDDGGFVDPQSVADAITPRTRLVVMIHASNAIGTVQPIGDVGAITRNTGVLLLIDAAQSIGLIDIDVQSIQCDMLAFPMHKELLGPSGIGGLYVAGSVQLRAWREGGTGFNAAHPVQPDDFPYHLEAGTPNTVAIAGVGAALKSVDPPATRAHVRRLLTRFLEHLGDQPNINILGTRELDRRTNALAFLVGGYTPHEVAVILDESFGIAVRAGMNCAPYVHKHLNTAPDGAVRISPGPYNTDEDMDQAAAALRKIAESR